MSETKMQYVEVGKILENPDALRGVNRTSEQYLELVDSVKRHGVLNAIVVREVKDPNGNDVFGLIDGLHRFSAARDAGLKMIPANITSKEDAEVLEAQIIANVHRIETKPVEYTKAIVRLLSANPLMTSSELSTKLAKSPTWVSDRLSLMKLPEEVGKLVDENKINLTNAYALAKLAKEDVAEVPNFLERAMTEAPATFVPTAMNRVKEIRDARRAGKDTPAEQWAPKAHLRTIAELKEEVSNQAAGPKLIKQLGITDPIEAFNLGLKFCLHLDPDAVAAAKAKDEARKAAAEAEKIRKKEEKEAAKAKEGADIASQLSK